MRNKEASEQEFVIIKPRHHKTTKKRKKKLNRRHVTEEKGLEQRAGGSQCFMDQIRRMNVTKAMEVCKIRAGSSM